MLELSKGKLTSDKKRHSGEGIYFTSRMFSKFSINAGSLFYQRDLQDDDEWLIEVGDRSKRRKGTGIYFKIHTDATWSTDDIFTKYLGDDIGFRKTHVPVKLGLYLNDELVSRSQAKRMLTRFENFSEVLLDFDGVPTIGQAFADEIFRVFANEHTDLKILSTRTSAAVQKVIDHVVASGEIQDSQGELPLPTPHPRVS